ncbi:MAG: prolipoprotein diacylglyceryl transferase [Planctomycetes bacterium]|nr:prolipoprotein diacylglyceryl transferase [Planctomycetota bacterium]
MRTLLKDTVVLSAALCVIAVCAFSLDTSAQPSKASSGTLPTVQARGIWAYPAIMCAAVVTGIMLGRRSQRSLGLSDWERLGIGLGAFCGAMIGAKLPFVLADWEGLLSGRAWFDSGKTIVFGLVGGYFGVELAKWALGIRIKTGDSFAVPVAAAVAVGRLACFVGGCCYGTVTRLPWGVDFGDGELRHPTQLYEFAFHLSAALVLHRLQQRQLLRGQLIKLYIIAYLAYRFLTEFIRPEPVLWAALTGYQLAALAFIPLFILLWFQDQR